MTRISLRFFVGMSLWFASFPAIGRTAELKGKFVLNGVAPAAPKIVDPKADWDFPGLRLIDESLVVDPTSLGIGNIAVYVRTPNVPITEAAQQTVAPQQVVEGRDGQFRPRVSGVWIGRQKLLFRNSGQTHVNANFPAADVNPLLGPMNKEFTVPLKRSSPAPQEFHCNIFVWMKGYVLPHDNPYFAVSAPDGSFSIKHLPTGVPLEFQVWHEKTGFLNADPTWTKGRFTITLDADRDLGAINVPRAAFR